MHLEAAISEQTAELAGLSHYLQKLQEEEKAKIARGRFTLNSGERW